MRGQLLAKASVGPPYGSDHSGVARSGPGVTARILMPGARTLVPYLTLSPGVVDPTSWPGSE